MLAMVMIMPLILGSALHTGHVDRTVAREDHISATFSADGVSRCQALYYPGLSNYFLQTLPLMAMDSFFSYSSQISLPVSPY
jgi:hypothetical protein